MSKKTAVCALIIGVVALGLSIFAVVKSCCGSKAQEDVQYVLYLGTNGPDNKPVFTPETAKEKAKEILIDMFGGYTIQEANGGWIEGGTVYQEYTLVIYLSDTSIDQVHAACDKLIQVFSQSSILIQSNRTTTEFYSSK